MAIDSLLNSEPELLTSEERWRRWEQRGRDNDARFMRQARRLLWSGAIGMAFVVIFLLS